MGQILGDGGFNQIPGFALGKGGCQGDKFGAVNHRAATNCQQEGDAFFAHDLDGFHQGIVIGIGFNAAKFKHSVAFEGLFDLVIDTIFLDRPTAVEH